MKYSLWGLLLVSAFFLPHVSFAETAVSMSFPVGGDSSFINDFGFPRAGHKHIGNDIMAPKMAPIFAPVDGIITFAPTVQPSYGYMLKLLGDNGYTFAFLHINNDTPGTDDGRGGVANAYAPGVTAGARVERGQLIAWVGDSGNAESTASHLHFEMYAPGGVLMNPFISLTAARAGKEAEANAFTLASATTIDDELDVSLADGDTLCDSGSLLRASALSTVYYCGRDGGRYVFQDENTYFSWYNDFTHVKFVSPEDMAALPLRGTITYKPGTTLVKMQSAPQVFMVGPGGSLRWITTPEIATSMFGVQWASKVRDVPDSFFTLYQVGEPIGY